jgi:MinD-like ATPase involved in chromosome partitioning or flagellar assembly
VGGRVQCVLVLAGGAGWESAALAVLSRSREYLVLKRCVDVADLMAAATTGQADLALVALEVPGLDPTALDHLHRHRIRVIGIEAADPTTAEVARVRRVEVRTRLAAAEIERVVEVLAADPDPDPLGLVSTVREATLPPGDPGAPPGASVIACWGPQGAPGRTTVAIGIAAELARRELTTLLIDADPWGGAVAQQLGVLDEVSGVLAASRWRASRELAVRSADVQRGIGVHLRVVTGLPRPDRWAEVRPGTIEQLCELGRRTGRVVVDTGFSLEDDPGGEVGSARRGRNAMTLAALSSCDQIVVVGSADPVGLARLARGLSDLTDTAPGVVPRVVVNRMRPTLGWSEKEIIGLVSGFGKVEGIHVLPEDRRAVDAALVSGDFLTQGPLAKAISSLVDVLSPESMTPVTRRGIRRRKAGTARPR